MAAVPITVDMDRLFATIQSSGKRVVDEVMGKMAANPMEAFADLYQSLLHDYTHNQQFWMDLQSRYVQRQMQLWMSLFGKRDAAPVADEVPADDKRFAAREWRELPLFDYIRRSYLLTSEMLLEGVDHANLDAETKRRLSFMTRQFIDAMSPANYAATNPEVLRLALETGGESLAAGYRNLVQDMEKRRISMTDESAFEVGRDLAVTPGQVIYQNQVMQLIQYSPSTAQVYRRPLLCVPPCINKFYIMDLQPDGSLVKYMVDQGHTVFLVSWKNATQADQQLTWDDYVGEGVIRAIEVVGEITREAKINVLAFCVGGTLAACALAALAARGEDRVESLTLMTTLLAFTDVGDIGVDIDRSFVESREQLFRKGGLVPGAELAAAFSSLRANDLVWSYVVNNYLKGKTPDAFDLLYWNTDATNLPGPMFAYYLRTMYLENNLVKPGKLTMCGQPIDLGRIAMPIYVFAALEDHIVPWRTAYESAQFLGDKPRFVLGASGHVAGTINPVSKGRRNYWVDGDIGVSPDAWFESAESRPGSWWADWAEWAASFGGARKAAPESLGSRTYRPIEPAPGSYVKALAVKTSA